LKVRNGWINKKMNRKIVVLGIVFLIISSYFPLPMTSSAQEKQKTGIEQKSAGLADGVVAVVNGEEILSNEYRSAYKKAEEFYRETYQQDFNDEFVRKLNIKTG